MTEKKPRFQKVDNGDTEAKVWIRQQHTPPGARVLDLFCGAGVMYERVYRGIASEYLGLDKQAKGHPGPHLRTDNKAFLKNHGCSGWNVFDLDAYDHPLWQAGYIIGHTDQDRIVLFITDGTPIRSNFNPSKFPRLLEATEGFGHGAAPRGVIDFYWPILVHFFEVIAARSGFTIEKMGGKWKKGKRVLYYFTILKRAPK